MKIEFISSDPHKEEFSYEAFDYGDLFRPANYSRAVFVLVEDGAIQIRGAEGMLLVPIVWSGEEMENDVDFLTCVTVHGSVELKFDSSEK